MIAQQLYDTRAREDRRCLGLESSAADEADSTLALMAGSDDASQAASQSHTQMAFGTQLAHAARARPSEDAPQFLGVNRLEPVLAGNTQREDIRPVPPKVTPSALLSLLHRTVNPNTNNQTKPHASPSSSPRKTVNKPRRPAGPPATQMLTQLPSHVDRHPPQTQKTREHTVPISPEQSPVADRVREPKTVSPRVEESTEHYTNSAVVAQESGGNHLQALASQCSWMQDFEFTRNAFKVPAEQLNILRNPDSWHKPSPGCRFPDGNIPINTLTTLHRMADEKAATEAAPDSDDELDDDPSPEFPVTSITPSAESAPPPSHDNEILSSQISWSPSPSPQPPRLLTRSNQQLPPDSSAGPTDATIDDKGGKASAVTQTQHPILIDSSNEDEQNDPPSSPPVEEEPIVLDEDMEMEEYVPQGLGEDAMEVVNDTSVHQVPSASPSPRPVIQVKETPYSRRKNGQHEAKAVTPPVRKLSSSGTSKQTSSTSTIFGTYNDKTPSELQPDAFHSGVNFCAEAGVANESVQQLKARQQTSPHDIGARSSVNIAPSITMYETSIAKVAVSPHHHSDNLSVRMTTGQDNRSAMMTGATPVSGQMLSTFSKSTVRATSPEELSNGREHSGKDVVSKSLSLTPGRVKRKYDDSPSKRSGRHSKRREIKIPAFGDDTPDLADPVSAMRNYRDEEFRKYREARRPSTSLESRSDSAGRTEVQQHGDATQIDPSSVPKRDGHAPTLSPRHESLYAEPFAVVAASRSASVTSPIAHVLEPENSALRVLLAEKSQSTTTSSTETPGSVFELFKEAYPEYTGDVKHFQGQCTQIIKLDREDKMVPKWQWDDLIIRNRTDYKDYALQCVDQGENPEPYHRFYKDTIRDTIYRKGIIEGRSTLLEALRQLKVPGIEPSNSPRNLLKEKRSRASLPGAFNQPRPATKNCTDITPHHGPRQSLLARSQHSHGTPVKNMLASKPKSPGATTPRDVASSARSTPKLDPSRLSLDGAASPHTRSVNSHTTAGASAPFRDFVKAWKRTTSLTGSTKVSSEPGRELGRKS